MEKIADYATVRLLGEGSGGNVWLCRPPGRLEAPATQAAVKLLKEPTTAGGFQKVVEQLKAYAVAGSPHLVRLYDVGYWNEHVYVAMEYLEGGSLATAQLDRDTRVDTVVAAARGVHALHEKGIVHRALKPSNLFAATGAGGTAKVAEPDLTNLTTPRRTLGGLRATDTVEYMEQGLAHGEPPGRASDIWSLGACLNYALTGQSLYGPDAPRDSLLSMLRHVFTTSVAPSSELEPKWSALVERCIAPDRADRYPTAEAFADDVDSVREKVSQ